jgi:hypothetical protein
MKPLKLVGAGFLFGLGWLPVAVLVIWLYYNWPPWTPGEADVPAEFLFDTARIELSPVTLSRSADGMLTGLGEARNTSDRDCGFLQLDCDVWHGDRLLSHELTVVSGLKAGTSRGFTVVFAGVSNSIPLEELRVKTAIAQAFDGGLMKP